MAINGQELLIDEHNHSRSQILKQSEQKSSAVEKLKKFRKGDGFRSHAEMEYMIIDKPMCSLLAADYTSETFVVPPANFVAQQSGVSRSASDCSNISVIYNFPNNFSDKRRRDFINAFEYAVSIWESQLSGPVETVIDANFEDLGASVLGQARTNYIFRPTAESPWYGEALLNQLLSVNVSDFFPDLTGSEIVTTFNTSFGWYLGTDGNPPPGTYDFVTVVLHELGHGLGFFGSAVANTQVGLFGRGGFPYIYDVFVQNGQGTSIFDLAPLSVVSPTTLNVLQSNDLFIETPSMSSPNKIFAPSTWRGGSSYSHWDESTFPPSNPNSLMTPFLSFQEANHNPGSNTLDMFQDHGWVLSQDCEGPESQDLSTRCQITGISPDPNFPLFICDLPGIFSEDGGAFGPVGSHVMCFRVDGIDPFNQPLNADDYTVRVGGKEANIVFIGYDFDEDGEQYFVICAGGIESTGREDVPVKIKLEPGCTFTQGEYYDAPDCEPESQASPRSETSSEVISMAISPNPVFNELYLDLKSNGPGHVIVQDLTGRRLKNEATTGQVNMTINVSDLVNGVYYATFISDSQVVTTKFVKQ